MKHKDAGIACMVRHSHGFGPCFRCANCHSWIRREDADGECPGPGIATTMLFFTARKGKAMKSMREMVKEANRRENEEKAWWEPVVTDAKWVAVTRLNHPDETANRDDNEVREKYARGFKYAVLWDHVGDAYREYEPIVDELLALRAAHTELAGKAEEVALLVAQLAKSAQDWKDRDEALDWLRANGYAPAVPGEPCDGRCGWAGGPHTHDSDGRATALKP